MLATIPRCRTVYRNILCPNLKGTVHAYLPIPMHIACPIMFSQENTLHAVWTAFVDKSDRCQRPPNELVFHPAYVTPSNHFIHTTGPHCDAVPAQVTTGCSLGDVTNDATLTGFPFDDICQAIQV